jgi:hypothetical protein
MIDEQVAILEHRLTSKQVPPASTLLDHMIDDINLIIRNQHTASNNRSSYQFDKTAHKCKIVNKYTG